MPKLKSLLLAPLLLLSLKAAAQHVFFGERNLQDTTAAIHFDKDGFPYPDYAIPDSTIRQAYGSVYTWFQYNNEAFTAICANYDYFPESIDETTIYRLRDSIIARWVRKINSESKGYPAVAFYVHGFRKLYVTNGDNVTSVAEFGMLKDNLATYGKPKPYAVEVYWDALYDCCFSANHKRNEELFALYEEAAANARRVGLGLRRVLSQIETPHLQIVAHSLGARVVTAALFNEESRENSIAAPSQPTVSVVLIAPAIDGHKTFETYYERTSQVDFKVRDNYRLLVVYNEDDFVLLKKDPKTGLIGPGANKYGETSLGCNYKGEAVKLKARFRVAYPHSTIELLNKTSIGKCHSLRCYTQGTELKEVSDFLWKTE